MTDRPSALLTNSQRRGLLRGLTSEPSDRKLRQRIIERIRNSTIDLHLAFSELGSEDIQRAFQSELEPLRDLVERYEDFAEQTRMLQRRTQSLVQLRDDLERELQDLQDLFYDFEIEFGTLDNESFRDEITEIDSISKTELIEESENILDLADEIKHLSREIDTHIEDADPYFKNFDENKDQIQFILGEDFEGFQQWLKGTRQWYKDLQDSNMEILQAAKDLERMAIQLDKMEGTLIPPEAMRQSLELVAGVSRDFHGARSLHRSSKGAGGRYRTMSVFDLSEKVSETQFDPGMRERTIDSLAFYIRVADVVGDDMDDILEEAIIRYYESYLDDQVLDTVDVTLEAEDRQQVIKSAQHKRPIDRYSNAELRTLIDADTNIQQEILSQDHSLRGENVSDRLIWASDTIEEGLEITNLQVPVEYKGFKTYVDFVGRDSKDRIVFIEVLDSPTEQTVDATLERLHTLLEYTNKDQPKKQFRGLIVMPSHWGGESQQATLDDINHSDIDLKRIELNDLKH